MQGLADELGVSRVTLFRRVGSREELLSQALWLLTERMLEAAAARWEAERPEGELHTPGTGRHINAIVPSQTGLSLLLDDELTLTIRVLTDPRGRVQTGILVAFIEELLRRDVAEFGLVTLIVPGAPRTSWSDWANPSFTRTCSPRASPTWPPPTASSRPSSRASCRNRGNGGHPAHTVALSLASLGLHLGLVLGFVPAGRRAAATGRGSRGMLSMKKMMPPKQIQYHVFHCPAV